MVAVAVGCGVGGGVGWGGGNDEVHTRVHVERCNYVVCVLARGEKLERLREEGEEIVWRRDITSCMRVLGKRGELEAQNISRIT